MLTSNLVDCMQVCEYSSFLEKQTWLNLKRKILTEQGNLLGYVTRNESFNCRQCKGNKNRTFKLGAKVHIKPCASCNGTGKIVINRKLKVYDVEGVKFYLHTNNVDDLKYLGVADELPKYEHDPEFVYTCLFALLIVFDEDEFNKAMEKFILRAKFFAVKEKVFEIIKYREKIAV